MKSEEVKYVDIIISPEILTLYYLSKITKIDLITLTLLFEKLGTSLYYMFHILAKKKISYPSEANLLKAISFSEVVELLDFNPKNRSRVSDRDRLIFDDLMQDVVDSKYIRIKLDEVSSEGFKKSNKTKVSGNRCELHSLIKKYIRKERRRLDKLNSLELLYKDSPIRQEFINKVSKIVTNKNYILEIPNIEELIISLIDGYNKNG